MFGYQKLGVTHGPRELLTQLFLKIFICISLPTKGTTCWDDTRPKLTPLISEWQRQLLNFIFVYTTRASIMGILQEERVPFFNRKEEINQVTGQTGETCESL